MTTALFVWVGHRSERAVIVVFAIVFTASAVKPVGVAVATTGGPALFVSAAVLNRNAKHLPRSKRDQTLHEEQEHGDKFDNSGWHKGSIGLLNVTS
jgi:hypothetical protein